MKRLIAEFEEQSFTQIIFPHKKTDWCDYLQEAQDTFINIINTIVKYQKCLVICADVKKIKSLFKENKKLYFVEYLTNDTWARDCSTLCVESKGKIKLLDFTFTGWGDKFEANLDNLMSKNIAKYYSKNIIEIDFILEGGAIETNGKNLLLTSSSCMLNKNRNKNRNKSQITQKLKLLFGTQEILYLEHGYLKGDDTDSHIDTLARFINEDTIMYIKCEDNTDEHFEELSLMEKELQSFAKLYKLKLVSLPMTEPIYYEDERLPATYANFLFVNGAVLVPIYGLKEDEVAIEIFKQNINHLDIIPIDCSSLIKQHGSLHCVTMNFAASLTLLL
ncbi:MAG: agmatine deiminase [Sulfurimonas sp.]|nr:MAG: agmatine deiminase [Sulfurimonas sp.]